MPIRSLPGVTLALLLAAAPALASAQDIDKVNGSITVEAGQQSGHLSTVNGSIKVGANARIGDAETVNGSIKVEPGVKARDLSTVNGSIKVGERVQVNEGVQTVNGSVFIGRGSAVGGDVATVNGGIGLVDTDVAGGIDAVTGDLTVGIGSHVRGGVHYAKPGRVLFSLKQKTPRVIIGPGARVDGPLVFERKVDLYVHSSATIGPVTGATAVPYSGTHAPKR